MSLRDDKPILRGQPLGEGWFDLGALSQWTAEEGLYGLCGDAGIAVFLVDGKAYAIADTCPHAEASLSGGTVQRGCVVCPGHALMFDLATGECLDDRRFPAQIFPTRLVEGHVHVRLP
jgi:nitrite reductase/ring-hydroxylating ferredoxin subunit